MKYRRAIAIAALCFFGCSGKFTAKDRFEGVKDGAVRIYVRLNNDSDYDEGGKELNGILLGRGNERLKMLVAQGIVDKKYSDDAVGSVVFVRCFDEYCEGFIDYKIRGGEKK